MLNTISFISLKNGQGKTCISSNLGFLLYSLGFKVIFFDFDFYSHDLTQLTCGENFSVDLSAYKNSYPQNIMDIMNPKKTMEDIHNFFLSLKTLMNPLALEKSSIHIIPSYFLEPSDLWKVNKNFSSRQEKKIHKEFKCFMERYANFCSNEDIFIIFDTFASPDIYNELVLANSNICLTLSHPQIRFIKKTNQYIDFLQSKYHSIFMLCQNMFAMENIGEWKNDPVIPFCDLMIRFYLSSSLDSFFYLEFLLKKIKSKENSSIIRAEEKYFVISMLFLVRNILQKLDKFSNERAENWKKLCQEFFPSDADYLHLFKSSM